MRVANIVLQQVDRAISRVKSGSENARLTQQWMATIQHYKGLAAKVIDQTQRRVFAKEEVPSSEKVVSIFEHHTDIIVKGKRDVQYGHKINLTANFLIMV